VQPSLEEIEHRARSLEQSRRTRDASDAYLELAKGLQSEGYVRRVSSVLLRALRLNEKNGEAWHLFGVLHRERGKPFEADRAFRKAIKAGPNAAEHKVEYGVLLYMTREWEKAEVQLRASLETERTVRGLQFLGLTLAELGDMKSAVQLAQEAQTLSPEDTEVAFSLGAVLFRARRVAEAREILQRVVEEKRHSRAGVKRRIRDALNMGPDSVHSWMVIADIFDGLERRWEATLALRIATCIDRDNARAWYELSETVQSEHFHQEALNRAIVLNRGDPDILCANAISFYESGMKKEALDTLEEVLVIDPEHVDAQL